MINLDTNYINNCLFEDGKTIFFTITNLGYMDYTKNMLNSLNKLDIDRKILIVCLDKVTNDYFMSNGYFTYFIDLGLKEFSQYGTEGFSKCCYMKFWFIYQVIMLNYNILYTDGDIVFKKNPFDELKSLEGEEADVWIQNDTMLDNNFENVCAGFLYVKSTNDTKKYFNTDIPEFEKRYEVCKKGSCDQMYINLYVKPYIKMKLLPLYKFPNGQYFYKYNKFILDSIVMVHFNWIIGENKKEQMKKYNMWSIV